MSLQRVTEGQGQKQKGEGDGRSAEGTEPTSAARGFTLQSREEIPGMC